MNTIWPCFILMVVMIGGCFALHVHFKRNEPFCFDSTLDDPNWEDDLDHWLM